MDIEKIKNIIQIAHEVTEDEKDESYKLETFKIVLGKLLDADLIEIIKPIHETHTPTGTAPTDDIQIGMEELAANCELTVNELEDVITIKKNEVEIVTSITGNEAEQQVAAVQIILISHEIILKQDWIKASIIKESLRKSGIQDKSSHLAKYLKNQPTIFRMRGEKLGSEYKLTTQGRTSAYQIIRKLGKGE